MRLLYIPIDQNADDVSTADDFYNAMPCSYKDIKSNYDIPRTEYIREHGVKETITQWLQPENKGVYLCSIKGKSGSGKSTLLKRLIFDFSENCIIINFNNFHNPYKKISSQINSFSKINTRPLISNRDSAYFRCKRGHLAT